jgi:alkanesulfonate monooxygenase SsuD/methylene tetrahydromethanopterin reductase-like flavin-dependent oxidoreductase (luciferase family)
VRARMVAHGRNPDDCKVLFMVAPIVGETEADALERKRIREARAAEQVPQRLAFLGKLMNIDFGRMDLDRPIPGDLVTNGHQQTLDQFKRMAAGRTLRQTMSEHNVTALSVELIGTPDSVAAQMGEVMEEVGGDGFLFSMPNVSRRLLAEIEDGLVPALQDRGLVRSAYGHARFRDNLLEF